MNQRNSTVPKIRDSRMPAPAKVAFGNRYPKIDNVNARVNSLFVACGISPDAPTAKSTMERIAQRKT